MKLRIEIREDSTGEVIALYHSRWYGGSDHIFAEAIRVITEGLVPRFKAFQRALDKLPATPELVLRPKVDAYGPNLQDGRGKIDHSR